MTCDVMPVMSLEGDFAPPGSLSIEGALGIHIIVEGPVISTPDLFLQLFEQATTPPFRPRNTTQLTNSRTFTHISSTDIQTANDLHMLSELLEQLGDKQSDSPAVPAARSVRAETKPGIHRSLFALVSAMSSSQAKQKQQESVRETNKSVDSEKRPPTWMPIHQASRSTQEERKHHLRVEEREAGGDQKRDGGQQEERERKRQSTTKKVGRKTSASENEERVADVTVGSIENIYVKFMALMARILGQAEAEAHELYMKIKERTDKIDTLSLLMAKINSCKKDIDWSRDPQMRELVDRAREIGVDIPAGKYKWDEGEKHLLKENIQMRKDGMEKITQLERTDMQRYLQEASQCHQARSNVLKLLKEVVDTIIHNMRP